VILPRVPLSVGIVRTARWSSRSELTAWAADPWGEGPSVLAPICAATIDRAQRRSLGHASRETTRTFASAKRRSIGAKSNGAVASLAIGKRARRVGDDRAEAERAARTTS
jgi:hypothetical protein